jgi:hypothetical protein
LWSRRVFEVDQLDIEDQGRVRRDHTTGPTRAIAKLRRNDQGTLAAHLHAGDALVPAADHPAGAERKGEGLAAVARGIELGALLAALVEPAGVMHHGGLAGTGGSAVTDFHVGIAQARRGGDFLGGPGGAGHHLSGDHGGKNGKRGKRAAGQQHVTETPGGQR